MHILLNEIVDVDVPAASYDMDISHNEAELSTHANLSRVGLEHV